MSVTSSSNNQTAVFGGAPARRMADADLDFMVILSRFIVIPMNNSVHGFIATPRLLLAVLKAVPFSFRMFTVFPEGTIVCRDNDDVS